MTLVLELGRPRFLSWFCGCSDFLLIRNTSPYNLEAKKNLSLIILCAGWTQPNPVLILESDHPKLHSAGAREEEEVTWHKDTGSAGLSPPCLRSSPSPCHCSYRKARLLSGTYGFQQHKNRSTQVISSFIPQSIALC